MPPASSNDNGSTGFEGSNCTVTNCSATLNSEHGFQGGSGAVFQQCNAQGNHDVGIAVLVNCSVIECQVNGSAIGIDVAGSFNLIESNHVRATQTCYNIPEGLNLIIRNSATFKFSTTTGYAIGPGNAAGPILDAFGVETTTIHTANFKQPFQDRRVARLERSCRATGWRLWANPCVFEIVDARRQRKARPGSGRPTCGTTDRSTRAMCRVGGAADDRICAHGKRNVSIRSWMPLPAAGAGEGPRVHPCPRNAS